VRYTSPTNIKRFFLGRHHVNTGLSQADRDAIRDKDTKSRGAGFNEEEKLFLVEEMREVQMAGLEPTHIAQVRNIIKRGRNSKFLELVSDPDKSYEGQVQRYIREVNKFHPFEQAEAEYKQMKDEYMSMKDKAGARTRS